MYSIEWSRIFRRRSQTAGSGGSPPESSTKLRYVSGTVWALGFTSLLTDISSEMVASVLPIYLVTFLGMSPMMFGLIDGLHQGAAALVRVVGGVFADRWQRHKEVAGAGYGLSAACRVLLLVAGNSWAAITAVISLDRIGKGIRTGPRDALISHHSSKDGIATAFGLHRALDAFGAMLGPVIAFLILFLWPRAFDILFVVSFGVALLGLAVILTFVRRRPEPPAGRDGDRASFRNAAKLLREPRFRSLTIAGTVLGLTTISDSFLYLILQRNLGFGMTAFPLFFVGTSLATAALAVPCGQLADRVGRSRVLLGGYAALMATYVVVLTASAGAPWLVAIVAIGILGLFYASTDGVIAAMAAAILPRAHMGSGLSLLATSVNVARLFSSVAFGFAWSRFGIAPAIIMFLVALLVAAGLAAVLLRGRERERTQS